MSGADSDLLRRLGEAALRYDPVPPSVRRAASDALACRPCEQELAVLVFDSAAHPRAGVRGGGVRQLTYEAPQLLIEIELNHERRSLVGQVAPADGSVVHVISDSGGPPVDCECDELGRFSRSGLAAGRFSLRVVRPVAGGRRATDTPWLDV